MAIPQQVEAAPVPFTNCGLTRTPTTPADPVPSADLGERTTKHAAETEGYDRRPREAPICIAPSGEAGDPCTEFTKSLEESAVPRVGRDGTLCPGLYVLRDGIMQLASSHCMSLKENRHHAAAGVLRAKDRTRDEVDRLRFFESKVTEHQAMYDKALSEYETEREVLKAARNDLSDVSNLEDKLKKTKYIKSCETLVNSWASNLEIARERLAYWEFKTTRQVALVGKLTDAAHSLEVAYRGTCEVIETDIRHVEALTEFLVRTQT